MIITKEINDNESRFIFFLRLDGLGRFFFEKCYADCGKCGAMGPTFFKVGRGYSERTFSGFLSTHCWLKKLRRLSRLRFVKGRVWRPLRPQRQLLSQHSTSWSIEWRETSRNFSTFSREKRTRMRQMSTHVQWEFPDRWRGIVNLIFIYIHRYSSIINVIVYSCSGFFKLDGVRIFAEDWKFHGFGFGFFWILRAIDWQIELSTWAVFKFGTILMGDGYDFKNRTFFIFKVF